jgi:hypothetical protein
VKTDYSKPDRRNERGTSMGVDISELENKIERKIGDLEREKSRLKDDLKVVRQASIIADDFAGEEERSSEDSTQENWEERH